MKKILLFSSILLSLIAQSCSKSTEDLTVSRLNIEEAQAAFVNSFNNALTTKSADETYYSLAGGDYTPVWDMAKSNENEYIWSLEVPIISDIDIVLKNNETNQITLADRRLLFIKNKQTQVVGSFILVSTTTYTKSTNSNFEHLADNSSYSGYVLYSTLGGDFVALSKYNNGVETASVNDWDLKNSHNQECIPENCTENNHSDAIDEIMGSNEFGIMPRGNGSGQYYEGFCIFCGAPEPFCWCYICPNCKLEDCICGDACDKCDSFPCICNDHICMICGEYQSKCVCGRVLCHECGNYVEDCTCEKEHVTKCSECGDYHVPGNCKYICKKCNKFLSVCTCK